jgi:hypothetical protein
VRKIVRDASADDYTFAALVRGIVKSVPFRMRQAPAEGGDTTETAGATSAVATETRSSEG